MNDYDNKANIATYKLFKAILGHFFVPVKKQILQQIDENNVHPVSGAVIQTHNLLITSLLLWPLYQGSCVNQGSYLSSAYSNPTSKETNS